MRPTNALLALLLVATIGCPSRNDPALGSGFRDSFERSDIGPDWRDTGGNYRITEGHLTVAGARNHPLWLRRVLPREARVEFTTWTDSPDGDIKCEIFGDGRSYATETSYTATSYVAIFGGWRNTLNVLARLDEHGADRRVRRGPAVEAGKRYRFVLERRGNRLSWSVDGAPMHAFDDPLPLAGPGHDHFGFNNWEVEVSFDDLVVTPL